MDWVQFCSSPSFSLTLKIPDYLGQSAERRLAMKGFLVSCSLKKKKLILSTKQKKKKQVDGLAHGEKVPYLKFV